jgi:proteasome regulatory subunit
MVLSRKKKGVNYSVIEENTKLKQTIIALKSELNKFRQPPLILCEVTNITHKGAVVRLPNGNKFLVNISMPLVGKIKPGDSVLSEQKSLNIVAKAGQKRKFDVEKFVRIEKPDVNWETIGGLSEQIREIKEVIELPLKNPQLFKDVGIIPPKGVLLYGYSGTGKTILAKAIAASTNSTFIEVVGSELVQKFIGDGAKLVKDIFKLAKERSPSIIFIDEIDAIASERTNNGTSGEKEVQRTLMQLLAEIDGFSSLGDVKIIGATNRFDILDPAIVRPGRLDRLIEVPLPNKDARAEIFKIHSKNMKLNKVNYSEIDKLLDGFSGADIKALCTEAGYFAIRQKRKHVKHEDFSLAVDKLTSTEMETNYNLGMVG